MRLVNEDDVLEIIERVTNEAVEKRQPKHLIQKRIIAEISGLPTIEAQPVKHGRWELITQNKFTGTKTLRCTYCKNYFVVRDDTLNAGRCDAIFCPNCGSKNRLDGDSE